MRRPVALEIACRLGRRAACGLAAATVLAAFAMNASLAREAHHHSKSLVQEARSKNPGPKADAAHDLKICTLPGDNGYFYIPGSDSCSDHQPNIIVKPGNDAEPQQTQDAAPSGAVGDAKGGIDADSKKPDDQGRDSNISAGADHSGAPAQIGVEPSNGPDNETGRQPGPVDDVASHAGGAGPDPEKSGGQRDRHETVDDGGAHANTARVRPLAPDSTGGHGAGTKGARIGVTNGPINGPQAGERHGAPGVMLSAPSQLRLDAGLGQQRGGRNVKKASASAVKKTATVAIQPWLARLRRLPLSVTAKGWPGRNAIGLVSDKATDPGPHEPQINAAGVSGPIGASVGPHDLDHPKIGLTGLPVTGPAAGVTSNVVFKPLGTGGPSISGTGLVHVGLGPGTLGGRAKNVASINGTNFRR